MDTQTSEKIRALEQRVNWLTVIVICLAVGLTPIAGVMPLAIVGFLIALPILSFTHKWLPGIARKCGRLLSFIFRPSNARYPMQGQ
jgi:hypothetical protein